jgi:hypothetical protein
MVLWIQNYAYSAHRHYYNEEPLKIKGTGRTEYIYEKHRQLATLTNPVTRENKWQQRVTSSTNPKTKLMHIKLQITPRSKSIFNSYCVNVCRILNTLKAISGTFNVAW